MFTWRFFRQIATTDLLNFLCRPPLSSGTDKQNPYLFEGDPEDQAKKLYNYKEGAYRLKVIKEREHAPAEAIADSSAAQPTETPDANFN